MAWPIQSPTKCEVRSVIRFLNAKGERPAEIHKQIVVVYCNVMNRQNVTKWCREFSEGRTDVHDEQRSSRSSFISDDFLQEMEGEIPPNRSVTSHHSRSVFKTTIHEAVTKIRVQKIVRTLGTQNFNGRSQNETDGIRADVSHALRTGRR